MTDLVIQPRLFPRGFEILDHLAYLMNEFSSKTPSNPGKLPFAGLQLNLDKWLNVIR